MSFAGFSDSVKKNGFKGGVPQYAALLAAAQDATKLGAELRVTAMDEAAKICPLGPGAEAFAVPFLPEALKALGDKAKPVQESAQRLLDAVMGALTPCGCRAAIPLVLARMDGSSEKFQTLLGALKCLQRMCEIAPKQIGAVMTDVVPPVSALMADAKAEVRNAAMETLKAASLTIDNKDLKPLVPIIVNSIKDVNKVGECIQELSAVVFVANVYASALGLVVPLLLRGLKSKATATKRQCAVITSNMSKLVEDPSEAAPFLPQLIPELDKARMEVSDPEARGVCDKAYLQLCRIKAHYERNPLEKADVKAIADEISGQVRAAEPILVSHCASVAASLCDTKQFAPSDWSSALLPALTATGAANTVMDRVMAFCSERYKVKEVPEEADDAEELCNCKFTLAYGTKILLHNTEMRLGRGHRYGLLGANDSGKTTLMRAIANNQVDGFPDSSTVKTVFVEADIQGEQSHLSCLEYIFVDPRIGQSGIGKDEVKATMMQVGFTEKMCTDGVSTLSGGWRMKLALARAMLQKADILLLDEPTNHLDVQNVQWVMNYLNGLTSVTSVIVSHDSKLLDEVCTHIMQICDLKLSIHKGNLSAFVASHPEAKSYFELKSDKLKFTFPQPGFIEGVKHKGKPLMKMDRCQYTYPGNTAPTVTNITVRVSLASRVACVGPNGAGKSTMIKLLTGETVPDAGKGEVWKHPACRVGYIAQHAFHHIENHLNKTPNEYIRWRYAGGDDKEALVKDAMTLTPEEIEKCQRPMQVPITDEAGVVTIHKRIVDKLTGQRREVKKQTEYEVWWKGMSSDSNCMVSAELLAKAGFDKHMKIVDERIASRQGMYQRPLTQMNVEKHLEDVGLDREFGTHYRIKALSGGQKVKVVLASSMWNQPHILILDEPTNYLDRESLGALAGAIREYEGGVVMITHNNQFCSELCPETWVLERNAAGVAELNCKGDPEWMEQYLKAEQTKQAQVEEMTDALGNTVKVKQPKKALSQREKKKADKLRQARIDRGEEVSDEEEL